MCGKPLYLLTQPLKSCDGSREERGEIRVDMMFLPDRHTNKPVSGSGCHSFSVRFPVAARGRACHLQHSNGSRIRNMGTASCSPAFGKQAILGRTDVGRSLRSSPRTDKAVHMAKEVWTQM
jgi:hypothetical protein